MRSALPGLPARGESMTNPMAMVDSAMRQWQTAVQQMMETPAVAMAVASAEDDQPLRAARAVPSRKPKRPAKRKSGTQPAELARYPTVPPLPLSPPPPSPTPLMNLYSAPRSSRRR